MFKTKKLVSLFCGAVLVFMGMGGIAHAEPEFPDARALGVTDPMIEDFIQNCIIKNEDRFVYDEEHRNALTDKFDLKNGVYSWMPLSRSKILHAKAVNELLRREEDVRYNDAAIADWVFCELQNRKIECEEVAIAGYDMPESQIPPNTHLDEYYAVLIPQVADGVTQWYVCDVAAMTQYKKTGEERYRRFLFCPIRDYLNSYGTSFKGGIVIDREYRYFRDGIGVLGAKDIFCWLSQEGHRASDVVDIFAKNPNVNSKFMSSVDHYEKDLHLFKLLRKLAGLPDFPVHELILS